MGGYGVGSCHGAQRWRMSRCPAQRQSRGERAPTPAGAALRSTCLFGGTSCFLPPLALAATSTPTTVLQEHVDLVPPGLGVSLLVSHIRHETGECGGAQEGRGVASSEHTACDLPGRVGSPGRGGETPHILVWWVSWRCSPEPRWEQRSRLLIPASPFPPPSPNRGQKGSQRRRELLAQGLLSIPQGKP